MAIESELKPHLIGRGGSVINRLKNETGASIDMFKTSKGAEFVVVRGTEKQISDAEAEINKILRVQRERLDKEKKFKQEELERAKRESEEKAAFEDSERKRLLAMEKQGPFIPGWNGAKKRTVVPSVVAPRSEPVFYNAVGVEVKSNEKWLPVKEKKVKKPEEKSAEPVSPTQTLVHSSSMSSVGKIADDAWSTVDSVKKFKMQKLASQSKFADQALSAAAAALGIEHDEDETADAAETEAAKKKKKNKKKKANGIPVPATA